MILDRVADVWRLSATSDNADKEAYVLYSPLSPISLNFQPGSAEDVVIAGGVFGQTYVGFTTASGILEGDKLVFQVTGEVMMVRGKSNWFSPDIGASHIELLLTEFETNE